MSSPTFRPAEFPAADEAEVRALHQSLLQAWNERSASAMSELFAEDGELIGFDGSEVAGRAAIASHLGPIFANHPTPAFVGKVRGVRLLAREVALLSAVAGMVPSGRSDLEPGLNVVHRIIAVKADGRWSIALYQNTPAQYHGRPEAVRELTEELRQLLP